MPDASVDLVTCYIGLHHIAPAEARAVRASIRRMLRPGGMLILRDHDVTTPEMDTFVSLAHTVFNAGLGAAVGSEPAGAALLRAGRRMGAAAAGRRLRATPGKRLLQAHDPSDNVLMAFVKERA